MDIIEEKGWTVTYIPQEDTEGRENVDVIDNAITPHEAANKVKEMHLNANVVAVGIMLDNEQWNYLQQLKLRFLGMIGGN